MYSKYAKEVLALVIAAGTVLVTALGTSPQQNLGHLSGYDWLKCVVAFLATGAVTAFVTNVPGIAGGIIKAFVAGAGAFCTALITAYSDSIITQGELIGAIVAAVIAIAAIYESGPPVGTTIVHTPPNR
jgi:hypothetical protein